VTKAGSHFHLLIISFGFSFCYLVVVYGIHVWSLFVSFAATCLSVCVSACVCVCVCGVVVVVLWLRGVVGLQVSLPLDDAEAIVSCAGAGIFVFWQLGALKYISTHFDLSNVTLHGGSAGAVLSTFIASGVDLNHAVRVSYDIGMEARVWDKWNHFGLFGPLIRQWLEILLPPDAHIRCTNRIRILLTRVPGFRQQYVSQFASREELIDAVMASVHVPFFLNWKPLKSFRGAYYMDGTLDDFVSGENSPILGCNGKAFIVDYYEDPKLTFNRLDFLRLKTHKQVLHLVAYGHRYARDLDMNGGLDPCLKDLRVVPSGETARTQTHVRSEVKA